MFKWTLKFAADGIDGLKWAYLTKWVFHTGKEVLIGVTKTYRSSSYLQYWMVSLAFTGSVKTLRRSIFNKFALNWCFCERHLDEILPRKPVQDLGKGHFIPNLRWAELNWNKAIKLNNLERFLEMLFRSENNFEAGRGFPRLQFCLRKVEVLQWSMLKYDWIMWYS